MSEQKMERVNPTGSMFADAVRALAAIDRELGMPEDGCNSTQATLTAIRLLHSAHRDDVSTNQRLTALVCEAVRMLEGYKRAGWLTSGAAIDQANDFIGRVKRAVATDFLNTSRGERSQPATPDTKTGDGRLALPVDAPEIVTMSEPKDESVNQWQPIETAPKQRKIIVHYLNEAEKHRTVMACYYGEKSLEMHDDYDDVGTWDEESGTLFADAGWYEEHDSDNPILPLGGVPTHWMQLPEPPATTDPTTGGHSADPA